MGNILLDYFFPITSIEPTPAASTAFLKQVLIVVKPAVGVTTGEITLCTSMDDVEELTDNTEAQQLFNAGMSRVYVLPMDDLDLEAALEGHESDFYTVLVSSDFSEAEITVANATGVITVSSYANLVSGTDDSVTIEGVVFTAQEGAATPGTTTFQAATSNDATAASLAAQINAHPATAARVTASVENAVVTLTAVEPGVVGNDIDVSYTDNDTNVGITLSGLSGGKLSGGAGLLVGQFEGVVGVSGTTGSWLTAQAVITNRAAFHTTSGNKAKNMFYAFGKLLSNAAAWRNQQYIPLPVADDVDTLGEANAFFDDRVNFAISDDESGTRLGLFAAGGKAIVAPYIKRNIQIDMQSAALSYISGNQPAYTLTQAALLEDVLQKVLDEYIADEEITAGTVSVALEEDNFVASSDINIAEPKAMWRVFAEMRQTL